MNRRTFIQAAATVGILGLAGCSGTDDEPTETGASPTPDGTPLPSPDDQRTRTPDDAPNQTPPGTSTPSGMSAQSQYSVDTEGMTEIEADVSAGDDASEAISSISSGDLLVFPPGEYSWESRSTVTADNWGIRCSPDTVFDVPAGIGDGEEAKILATHTGDVTADNFLLENLTFDSSGRAAPGLHLGTRNTAQVSGLEYKMNGPLSDQNHENGVRAYVDNADGTLWIDDYCQLNNGDLGGYGAGDSRIGIWVGPKNDGTVHLRNPVLQGFPNNACYVSRQPGNVIVEGGYLVNNNVSAVRVSGGVEVRNTTVLLDIQGYLQGPGVLEGSAHNTRGFWGDNHGAGTNGGLVEDSTVILRSYDKSYGLAAILDNEGFTVRNCDFVLHDNIESVQAERGEITVENCRFRGTSTDSTAGIGNISGSGNCIGSAINPGDVPVEEYCPLNHSVNPEM